LGGNIVCSQTSETTEKIEGLGQDEDASLGDYPIDTVLIRNENRTVHDVLRRINKGSYILDPDFQRDFIWSPEKQCKLIESVLMRIPLPVFYLAENDKGQMVVVDGLQRLSTFQRFVNNELRLNLPAQPELNNKRFKDLSPKLQNRVEDCNLILYLIDAKVPTQALLDIFERVKQRGPSDTAANAQLPVHGTCHPFFKRGGRNTTIQAGNRSKPGSQHNAGQRICQPVLRISDSGC
jgi:hypothetical protein